MKSESLKALGAADAPEEVLQALGLTGARQPLERLRRAVPDTVAAMAQVVVDNPGQVALIGAGSMVAAQMAVNLMKPRTPAQAIALFVVLNVALPKLAWAAVEKGWITFRVRDDGGHLVPLVIGKPAA